jgi:hypothetical protein
MELQLKELSLKVYLLKEIVDFFEYSDKTDKEMLNVK